MSIYDAFSEKSIVGIVNRDLSPDAPTSENNIRSKMPGYNVIIRFPNCPIEAEKTVAFPAYVKTVGDNFNVGFNGREVYGRMDPIPVYSRTTRTISFSLDIPSTGLSHSRTIANKLNILVKNCYPSYEKNGFVNIISSSPLISVFFSNLIYDSSARETGLLGYWQGLQISHDLSNGVFARGDGFETYPKAYSLSVNMNVLHTFTPGYIISDGAVKNSVNILKNVSGVF